MMSMLGLLRLLLSRQFGLPMLALSKQLLLVPVKRRIEGSLWLLQGLPQRISNRNKRLASHR
jgi:hypothetical protein